MIPADAMTSSDESQGLIHNSGKTGVDMDSASGEDHDLHQNNEADMSMPSRIDISSSENLAHETLRDRILIIDRTAVVNSVVKTDKMKTCADFAESFLSIICNMAKDYDEVRVVFDRYLTPSLKSQTRRKRNQRKTTYYHIKDNTLIKNIPLKDFLSDTRKKDELTKYLANKIICHARGLSIRL